MSALSSLCAPFFGGNHLNLAVGVPLFFAALCKDWHIDCSRRRWDVVSTLISNLFRALGSAFCVSWVVTGIA